MLLFTEGGNTYAIREIIDWLRQAGYVNVKPIRMKKKAKIGTAVSFRLCVIVARE
jgi:hypothetical protein